MILEHFNCKLFHKRSISIMGSSGVGKTTLLNIIGLLDRPTEGDCMIKGQSTSMLSERKRALLRNQTYGFIFQNDRLIPHYPVLDNVALPLRYRGLSRKEAEKKVKECLDYFQLLDFASRYPRELSGGQRQRVALARAVVHQPSVLLADELTASLDQETKFFILERLFALKEKFDFSMILVTHDPMVAERCDHIINLHQLC